MPIAISHGLISLVLRDISQSLPLPPHLLSKPLLNRHYFLSITSDDYLSYLAWPSPSSDLLASALTRLSLPDDDDCTSYPLAYTADYEDIYAHVGVALAAADACQPHARLVFMWDNEDMTWKYHNLALMPFPQGSFSSVDQAMSQATFDQQDTDPASYWGTPDHPDQVSDQASSDSEDDYWARYSTIQGTGDSTAPSPLQKHSIVQTSESHEEHERVMVSYPAPEAAIYNPLEPPSPKQLARRLAALFVDIEDGPYISVSDSQTLSPEHPPDFSLIGDGVDFCATKLPSNAYLGDAIRAIYRLWRTTRPEDDSQDAFMEIVRQSIYVS
ncbi:hypothetical protein APHAL10511_006356 [Amanita phalloides]|nr:hypothetical protein APHAL10511_006356 [Amanita phalloides]